MMALRDHLWVPRGFEDDIDIILYYSDHLNGKKNPGKYIISNKICIFSSQPMFYENVKEQLFWITHKN